MLRTDVNEMDVDAVDVRHELRQSVQPRFHLAPVVRGPPVAHQLLEFCELDTLRPIQDGLLIRPSRGGEAPTEIDEILLRNGDPEAPNRIARGRCRQT